MAVSMQARGDLIIESRVAELEVTLKEVAELSTQNMQEVLSACNGIKEEIKTAKEQFGTKSASLLQDMEQIKNRQQGLDASLQKLSLQVASLEEKVSQLEIQQRLSRNLANDNHSSARKSEVEKIPIIRYTQRPQPITQKGVIVIKKEPVKKMSPIVYALRLGVVISVFAIPIYVLWNNS